MSQNSHSVHVYECASPEPSLTAHKGGLFGTIRSGLATWWRFSMTARDVRRCALERGLIDSLGRDRASLNRVYECADRIGLVKRLQSE